MFGVGDFGWVLVIVLCFGCYGLAVDCFGFRYDWWFCLICFWFGLASVRRFGLALD